MFRQVTRPHRPRRQRPHTLTASFPKPVSDEIYRVADAHFAGDVSAVLQQAFRLLFLVDGGLRDGATLFIRDAAGVEREVIFWPEGDGGGESEAR